MSASAKQFMLKTFPDPLYSTASYFIKDLGLDGGEPLLTCCSIR